MSESSPSQDPFTERWKATVSAANARGGTPAIIEAIEAWIAEIDHEAAITSDPHKWDRLNRERRELAHTLDQLHENLANRQAGRHVLQDGSQAYVQPNGSIVSAFTSISFEEPDGNGGTVTVDTGGPDRQRRHTEAVQQFGKSRQYREAVRRLRPAHSMTTRQARPRGRRERRHVARATSSSDPGGSDEPPAPGWRWAHSAGCSS